MTVLRRDAGVSFQLRLTPRGGRDAIDGWTKVSSDAKYLKARVRAIPEDGKANAALIALLASHLGVPKASVRIASGAASRLKRIEIAGDADALIARLEAIGEAR